MNLVDLKEKIENLDTKGHMYNEYGDCIGTTTMDAKRFKDKVLAILDDAIKSDENTTRWIYDHNDGATRICERCGHCEPYKNAGIETEIFDYCPFCGRRVINKRS